MALRTSSGGAVIPFCLCAPTNVVVFQWACWNIGDAAATSASVMSTYPAIPDRTSPAMRLDPPRTPVAALPARRQRAGIAPASPNFTAVKAATPNRSAAHRQLIRQLPPPQGASAGRWKRSRHAGWPPSTSPQHESLFAPNGNPPPNPLDGKLLWLITPLLPMRR
jgi:hypothetical protein